MPCLISVGAYHIWGLAPDNSGWSFSAIPENGGAPYFCGCVPHFGACTGQLRLVLLCNPRKWDAPYFCGCVPHFGACTGQLRLVLLCNPRKWDAPYFCGCVIFSLFYQQFDKPLQVTVQSRSTERSVERSVFRCHYPEMRALCQYYLSNYRHFSASYPSKHLLSCQNVCENYSYFTREAGIVDII